jgi:hypothetical protein
MASLRLLREFVLYCSIRKVKARARTPGTGLKVVRGRSLERIDWFWLRIGTGAIASINPHNPYPKLSQL